MNTTGDSEAEPNVRAFTQRDGGGNVVGVYLDHPGEPCVFKPDPLHPSTGRCGCGRLDLGIVRADEEAP